MDFDNKKFYVILDLEGTMEITEMSSVIYDKNMNIISSIQCFVENHFVDSETFKNYVYRKYGRYNMADTFLKNMKPLHETMCIYDKWIHSNVTINDAIFITCGNWDLRKHIPKQFNKFNLTVPIYFKSYINIKEVFQNIENVESKGMDFMLDYYNIKSIGNHHCAYYDVHNIGQILQYILNNTEMDSYNNFFKIKIL